MPWVSPSLKETRELVRGEITSKLAGASFIGNSVLRVMADATAAMAHFALRFIKWISQQLLPDTAETEWLDRHGDIWLTNANNTTGRKVATLAQGSVFMTGIVDTVIPLGTRLASDTTIYETIQQGVIGVTATEILVRAIDAGVNGNLNPGDTIALLVPTPGIDNEITIKLMIGGVDQETDEELRVRVLERIREPPMGGDAEDYVAWALQVPGVTRAWTAPLEMGMGTVTLRFMMDDLRKTDDPKTDGFPNDTDVATVWAYLDSKRPVAVKDFFVVSPIPFPVDFALARMSAYDASTIQSITDSVKAMLRERAHPARAINGILMEAQTIYQAWISDAVLSAMEEDAHFNLAFNDLPMPSNGHMAVLGKITIE
jgi:uncharacterized phage protein gp47/JayE